MLHLLYNSEQTKPCNSFTYLKFNAKVAMRQKIISGQITNYMKGFITVMVLALSTTTLFGQVSRLHVKSPSGSTLGITAGGSTNKVIGMQHDGTAGIISTTTLNGATEYTPLKFLTAGLTRLTIFENGFVGIGVSSTPTAELTVGGKIHAREVKVNVSAGGAPDYVFGDSYYLRPLSEVSLFINQYHHLPEVPPAVEMEKEGVNLSDMNMLLLKKVEELTLYLIDQNEKIEEMKLQLQKLQQEIKELSN